MTHFGITTRINTPWVEFLPGLYHCVSFAWVLLVGGPALLTTYLALYIQGESPYSENQNGLVAMPH